MNAWWDSCWRLRGWKAARSVFRLKCVALEELLEEVIDDANYEAKPHHKEVKSAAACRRAAYGDHQSSCAAELKTSFAMPFVTRLKARPLRFLLPISARDHAILTVRDHGPGVPEAELQHIFEPFYRVGEARERSSGGVGLGLSIADRTVKLARRHHPRGKRDWWLLITIELPVSPSPAVVQSAPEKMPVA